MQLASFYEQRAAKIVSLVAQGYSFGQIARAIGISRSRVYQIATAHGVWSLHARRPDRRAILR